MAMSSTPKTLLFAVPFVLIAILSTTHCAIEIKGSAGAAANSVTANKAAAPPLVQPFLTGFPQFAGLPRIGVPIPSSCICGVFLSGQFTKGSQDPPKGNPALLHEHEAPFACTALGNKQCTSKCLDSIVKHLPNSPAILCGSIDRDCHKERAYLFIQNCNSTWINTNLSAGREYCCKDGVPYKCPLLS